MKQFKFLPAIIILAVLLSACGAAPVPTMSPENVQNTAVAAAFTVVAQTQQAIPTATPLPPTSTPTETPLPTSTPLPLPTSAETLVPTTAPSNNVTTNNGNATVDPCSTRVLNYSPKGQPTTIRIMNLTKAQVTVSLYLNETAGKGECGYRSYVISKNNDVVITDLVQGCYNLWAWSTDNKAHVNAGGSGCINNPDKWTFEIGENSIKFTAR